MILNELPADHLLRNKPLAEIGAEQRLVASKNWRKLAATWPIAKKSFNELGPAWTETAEWRATVEI